MSDAALNPPQSSGGASCTHPTWKLHTNESTKTTFRYCERCGKAYVWSDLLQAWQLTRVWPKEEGKDIDA